MYLQLVNSEEFFSIINFIFRLLYKSTFISQKWTVFTAESQQQYIGSLGSWGRRWERLAEIKTLSLGAENP